MASLDTTTSPVLGIDAEKDGPTTLYTPLPDYQATYLAGSAQPEWPARRRRFRAVSRIFHAILFTSLLVYVVPRLVHRLAPSLHLRFGKDHAMDHHSIYVPNDCTYAEWTFDPEGIVPPNQFEHAALTSFELPLDSDELIFASRGTTQFANGVVNIVDSGVQGSDNVHVDVTGYYNSEHHFTELTKVCQLHPEERKNGVGIFTAHHWPGHADYRHRIQFRIDVHLPRSSDGSPVTINKLSTRLPMFAHHVGDLGNAFIFKGFHLQTVNMPIAAESLVAETAGLISSNSVIKGSFNTSRALNLVTSNAPIEAYIGMFNDDAGEATLVHFRTSNSPISTNISMVATTDNGFGGLFDIGVRTSNGPILLEVPHAPADHVLLLRAHTSNSPIEMTLHPAFEGTFMLHGSNWLRPSANVRSAQDPAGRGRQRRMELQNVGRADVRGAVRWLPAEDRQIGNVEVSTSNMGIKLIL